MGILLDLKTTGALEALLKANKESTTEVLTEPTVAEMKDLFKVMLGVCMRNINGLAVHPDVSLESIMIDLELMGFFEVSASSSTHHKRRHDLVYHTLDVVYHIMGLEKLCADNHIDMAEMMMGALFHDLCKTDDYIWADEGSIHAGKKVNKARFVSNPNKQLGHGTKSLLFMAKWFKEVPVSIRSSILFHMGPWVDEAPGDKANAYSNAVSKYFGVLIIHTADMASARGV